MLVLAQAGRTPLPNTLREKNDLWTVIQVSRLIYMNRVDLGF